MTAPLCACGCGKPVERRQYETDGQWKRREKLGIYRDKCRRSLNLKTTGFPKDRPTLVADSTVWNLGAVGTKAIEKEKPVRDAARLAFARSLPCAVCTSIEAVHAHHEQLNGGIMGGKVSDRLTLPLCWKCHVLRHDVGREVYGNLDVERVIAEINKAYDQRRRG